MLVLSRKAGETILIGDQIEVTILRLSSGAVRIGVNAPGECRVMRKELVHPEEDEVHAEPVAMQPIRGRGKRAG
jgi:carbon storage regulator